MEFARDCDSGAAASNCKNVRKSSNENLDVALLHWFNQNGLMCAQKA
jgi:hypothetical protein